MPSVKIQVKYKGNYIKVVFKNPDVMIRLQLVKVVVSVGFSSTDEIDEMTEVKKKQKENQILTIRYFRANKNMLSNYRKNS